MSIDHCFCGLHSRSSENEYNFGAVVVERRRVPVCETWVDHLVEPNRIHGIRNIEKDAVSGTRSGGETDFRKHGDVVALVGLARLLRPWPMFASLPQTCDRTGIGIRKDARSVYDARLLRSRDRDLDDVDAEKSGVRIFARTGVRTLGELFPGAYRARPGAKDINVALVVGVGHHGVRVRAPASLDRGDLFRHPHVADIEDPDPAKTRVADRLRDPLKTAIEPAPCLLDRHDQKISDDGYIALASGTDDRA